MINKQYSIYIYDEDHCVSEKRKGVTDSDMSFIITCCHKHTIIHRLRIIIDFRPSYWFHYSAPVFLPNKKSYGIKLENIENNDQQIMDIIEWRFFNEEAFKIIKKQIMEIFIAICKRPNTINNGNELYQIDTTDNLYNWCAYTNQILEQLHTIVDDEKAREISVNETNNLISIEKAIANENKSKAPSITIPKVRTTMLNEMTSSLCNCQIAMNKKFGTLKMQQNLTLTLFKFEKLSDVNVACAPVYSPPTPSAKTNLPNKSNERVNPPQDPSKTPTTLFCLII